MNGLINFEGFICSSFKWFNLTSWLPFVDLQIHPSSEYLQYQIFPRKREQVHSIAPPIMLY